MQAWFRIALTVPIAALCLGTCAQVRITHSEAVAPSESLVADLSLGLFLDLASRLVQAPSSAPSLLQADPKEPTESLRALGIDYGAFRQRLAETANVRPMILFVPHGADLAAEARKHDLPIDSWPELAPPALLSGPEVDVLIVFDPLASDQSGTAGKGAVALTRIASLSGLANLALTREQQVKELNPQLYRVNPREWKKSVLIEHTRCSYARADSIVTKLMYQGGSSEYQTTALTEKSWGPCNLVSGPELRAVTVKQKPNLKQPKRPLLIAASYFQDPEPGPLIADSIWVK